MAFVTMLDLKEDALWLAGEDPSGLSPYDGKAVAYLNAAQLALISGSPLKIGKGELDLQLLDWWWARGRGAFVTEPILGAGATLEVTEGSAIATFSLPPAGSVVGYRLRVEGASVLPRVNGHTAGATTITMDQPWIDLSQAAASFHLFRTEYALASDFVRFAGPPILASARAPVPVIDPAKSRDTAGAGLVGRAWVPTVGTPTEAAFVDLTTLELDAVPIEETRFEYWYVRLPPDLVGTNDVPLLPVQHRRVLSLAAAALLLVDKSDDKATDLLALAQAAYRGLVVEQQRMVTGPATAFGAVHPRPTAGWPSRALVTESGVPLA